MVITLDLGISLRPGLVATKVVLFGLRNRRLLRLATGCTIAGLKPVAVPLLNRVLLEGFVEARGVLGNLQPTGGAGCRRGTGRIRAEDRPG